MISPRQGQLGVGVRCLKAIVLVLLFFWHFWVVVLAFLAAVWRQSRPVFARSHQKKAHSQAHLGQPILQTIRARVAHRERFPQEAADRLVLTRLWMAL